MQEDRYLNQETKAIMVVLLLVFAYPIGLMLMWAWLSWPRWMKIVLTLPVLLLLAVWLMAVLFVVMWGMNV